MTSNGGSFLQGTDRLKGEVFLDTCFVDATWAFYQSDPLLLTCRDIISRYLFSNGISFTWGTEEKKLTVAFQELVTNHWVPMSQESLDVIFVTGLLPVSTSLTPLGDPIPVTLKPGTYDISTYVKDDQQVYRVWRKNPFSLDNKPAYYVDPTVYVFDHFKWRPTIDGRLTTPISRLMPKALFEAGLYDCALVAEHISCNPPLITEARETGAAKQTGMEWDLYADGDKAAAREQDKFQRNAAEIKLLALQQETYQAYIARARGGGTSALTEAQSAKPWDSEYPLGQDRHLVLPQAAKARPDLVNIIKTLSEEKCAAMGVPRSMIANETASVRGNLEAQNEGFRQNIMAWRDALARVLTQFYHALYGTKDAEYVFAKVIGPKIASAARGRDNAAAPKSSKAGAGDPRPAVLTESDLYTLREQNKVSVSFPIPMATNPDELTFMFGMGVISWQTYAESLLRAKQIPISSMDQKTSPWKPEERKLLALGGAGKGADGKGGAAKSKKPGQGGGKSKKPKSGS